MLHIQPLVHDFDAFCPKPLFCWCCFPASILSPQVVRRLITNDSDRFHVFVYQDVSNHIRAIYNVVVDLVQLNEYGSEQHKTSHLCLRLPECQKASQSSPNRTVSPTFNPEPPFLQLFRLVFQRILSVGRQSVLDDN